MLGLTMILVAATAAATPPGPTPTPFPRSKISAVGAISKASEPPRGRSLSEVARGIKLRFPSNKPRLITNDSLKELSAGAELTTAAPAPTPAPGSSTSSEEQQTAEKKAYWQDRYFAARQELINLEAEQQRLAADVARLEREFYSRDDPYQRDNVIKPAWDEAVSKLRDVQQRLEGARSAPETISNEARRDGALPGWFREIPSPTPVPQGRQ